LIFDARCILCGYKTPMALFRLEAKVIGRIARGRTGKATPAQSVSIVAKSAYRAGQSLKDEQQDRRYNYRSRSQEVAHTEIMALPKNVPDWLKHGGGKAEERAARQRLWNEVAAAEKRKDAQLAREFVIALPVELTLEQQIDALRSWCGEELVGRGMVADLCIHRSKDGKNPHAHILCPMRELTPEGFGLKNRGWNSKALVGEWRAAWETHCNAALEAAGHEERVDHRSLKDRGIDRAPEPKIGVTATAMQRRGKEPDPQRARQTRWARMDNQIRAAVHALKGIAEVAQFGAGSTWWQRARGALEWAREQAVDLLQDESSGGRAPSSASARSSAPSSWQEYVTARREQPERHREPDIEPSQ
jgi:MobA/MobL family